MQFKKTSPLPLTNPTQLSNLNLSNTTDPSFTLSKEDLYLCIEYMQKGDLEYGQKVMKRAFPHMKKQLFG